MADQFQFVLTILCTMGTGLITGVFFAFSAFVMRALARLPEPQGIAAMQSINIAVINPAFLGVFVGTAISGIAVIVIILLRWERAGAAYLLAGALLYLGGTFLVTILFNVPLNNTLAAAAPTDADSARLWAEYLWQWTL
jgi:uncharacterized membrane protein